jgi:hypothetical protein
VSSSVAIRPLQSQFSCQRHGQLRQAAELTGCGASVHSNTVRSQAEIKNSSLPKARVSSSVAIRPMQSQFPCLRHGQLRQAAQQTGRGASVHRNTVRSQAEIKNSSLPEARVSSSVAIRPMQSQFPCLRHGQLRQAAQLTGRGPSVHLTAVPKSPPNEEKARPEGSECHPHFTSDMPA